MQQDLFESQSNKKSYRAIRHDVVRKKQKEYSDNLHHPVQKIKQIEDALEGLNGLKIIEFFAGQGNLSPAYLKHGQLISIEKNKEVFSILKEKTNSFDELETIRSDSFRLFHSLISQKKKFDVVDLDPYGFPTRLFPDVYLLIEDGLLFVTFPKPYVNILNGITQTHLFAYFQETNPTKEQVVERLVLFGLCHWRKVELISCIDLKSVWRFCFRVQKVKATKYTGVKNR